MLKMFIYLKEQHCDTHSHNRCHLTGIGKEGNVIDRAGEVKLAGQHRTWQHQKASHHSQAFSCFLQLG